MMFDVRNTFRFTLAASFVSCLSTQADAQTFLKPWNAAIAVTVNSDNGAEIVMPTGSHISHAWEEAPGKPTSNPWTTYKPGGDHVVMAHDKSGRLLIAWLAGGQLELMTEPFVRSSLNNPIILIKNRHLKDFRVVSRSDGTLMIAALDGHGSVLVGRQTQPSVWNFVAAELGGYGYRTISAAGFDKASRFAIACLTHDREIVMSVEKTPQGAFTAWQTLAPPPLSVQSAEINGNVDGTIDALALDQSQLLYHLRIDTSGAWSTGWATISNSKAGNAFEMARLPSGALIAWGQNGQAFSQNGPNGSWAAGGQGRPGAWAIGNDNSLINANPMVRTVVSTTVTHNPPRAGSDPTCTVQGVNAKGDQCVPPAPAYDSTSTNTTTTYEVHIIRNGVETILINGKP